jgi:cobalt/nickel transport system permease protein
MTPGIQLPPHPESFIAHLDPRWKLAALLVAAAVTISLRTLPAAAIGLAGACALAVVARLPFRWWLSRLAAATLVLTPFLLLAPFVVRHGPPAWPLGIAPAGLTIAAVLLLKTLTLVTLVLVLLATAPLPATCKAAHALRVPGLFVQLALLTYRYVFVLAAELGRIRIALRVRAYRHRASRHSYRTVGHVAGTLLVRGAERAQRIGQAMRCRGFDGQFRAVATFQTAACDILFFTGLAGGSVVLGAWDFMIR